MAVPSKKNTQEANTWEEFQSKLKDIRDSVAGNGKANERFLYRGLDDAGHHLTTTLERRGRQGMPLIEYYDLIFRLRSGIEAQTGRRWSRLPDPSEIEARFREERDPYFWFPTPAVLGYMAYLRHHGFPSPLLDWSSSPYVAAFFAFSKPPKPPSTSESEKSGKRELPSPVMCKKKGIEMRSICVLSQRSKWYVEGFGTEAKISPSMDQVIQGPARHFDQLSEYTICRIHKDGKWRFASHEDFFGIESDQDVLYKINIPVTERLNFLHHLNQYNLNAFSLFKTEDALMETLAVRVLELGL